MNWGLLKALTCFTYSNCLENGFIVMFWHVRKIYFLSTSRISQKILEGHQKHRVSEASKTESFLRVTRGCQESIMEGMLQTFSEKKFLGVLKTKIVRIMYMREKSSDILISNPF